MKGFIKIALILSLILVILGSTFCMIGLGIGFNFNEFWEEVEDGKFSIGSLGSIPIVIQRNYVPWMDDDESFSSADREQYVFSLKEDGIQELDMDIYYGTVFIEENTDDTEEIQVTVEYRKSNHKRKVEAGMNGGTLEIKETGSKRSIRNDSTRVTIRIPSDMEKMSEILRRISLKQDAGEIIVNMPLTAEQISINVNAGECEAVEKLTALEKFTADVGAGEIELADVTARQMELVVNVGEITADRIAADLIDINCGTGSVEAEAAGAEQDYNYEVKCSVGDVTIGESSFSGLGNKRKIENHAAREIKVECNIGDVEVSFEGL
ncbi:DUF4097 family beta strand repeat-containing protein [Lachnospiraceae bacterium 45-W7]